MKNIKDSIVLVTGANRGLGLALVQELLAKGAAKVYAATRKPHDFNDPRVVNMSLDVTDTESIAKLSELAPDVNVLINNAGFFYPDTIMSAEMKNVRQHFETNVFGPLQIVHVMAPVLKANAGGVLINIVSVGAWLPFGSYGASKAALWSITNSLRQELTAQDTKVIGVYVGPMDTDMVRGIIEGPKDDPKDVARIVVEGMEHGENEVLVDDLTRHTKSLLSGPVDELRLPN